MMAGMVLGVVLYRPIFSIFLKDTDVKNWIKSDATNIHKLSLKSDTSKIDEYTFLITEKNKIDYKGLQFTESKQDTTYLIGTIYPPLSSLGQDNSNNLKKELHSDSKPTYSNVILSTPTYWKFVALVFVMILFVTMVYGPIAAFLVEMFPTKIRYTSMSLPYHIGNGVFGGLVPFIGLLLTTSFTKDPLVGLWYPIGVAALCFLIGTIYLTNKIDKDVTD
jgi:hypothetical protein